MTLANMVLAGQGRTGGTVKGACGHEAVHASLDRWHECHWHIHQMERWYHDPEPLRFSLNSFIRAAKEVPQLMKMELQGVPEFPALRREVDELYRDPLFDVLRKKRDFVVHRGMLDVLSTAWLGVARGSVTNMQISFEIATFESSDEAYERYKERCRTNPSFRSLVGADEDTYPYIRREWKLPDFPGGDVLESAVAAWQRIGSTISRVLRVLDASQPDLSPPCFHDPASVKVRRYSQREYLKTVYGFDPESEGDDEVAG